MKYHLATIACGALLAGCASLPPPVTVNSTRETEPGTARREVPRHPAIWTGAIGRNESGLIGSTFVVGTDRGGHLIGYDFHGAVLWRGGAAGLEGEARLTDLDISSLPLEDSYAAVMGGPERISGRTRIVLFRLDRGPSQTVRRWGVIATDLSEPAGFCMRQRYGVVQAVIIDRKGAVRQFTVAEGPGGELSFEEVRRFRIMQSGRGCAIVGAAGHIYFSHARQGFWQYGPDLGARPVWLRATPSRVLPRSTGLSYVSDSSGNYLVSQDQGRAAFSVWRLGPDVAWLGRFEVREPGARRAVRSPAGVDAYGVDVGPFENGVVVVHDQANDGRPNLKYVDWSDVKRALGL